MKQDSFKRAVTVLRGIGMNRCSFKLIGDAAAPVINNPELALEFQKSGLRREEFIQVLKEYDMSMGADDFADYLLLNQVSMVFRSSSSEETSFDIIIKFDIDENILSVGVL